MTPLQHAAAMVLGGILDLLLGDPHGIPHPVCAIGCLISSLEKFLRKRFPESARGEFLAGFFLDFLVMGITLLAAIAVLYLPAALAALLFGEICGTAVSFAAEVILTAYLLAARSLRDESMKVFRDLEAADLIAARHDVSMIVGRDTEALDVPGVTRAAVETVAEGTSDGVIAPVFYLMIGGPILGWVYKSINTMDSMVGYKNERYRHFGTAAAHTDDIVNFLPSRIAALLLIAASPVTGLDAKGAFRIFRRDRFRHASPNSAQTESVMAGALGVRLAGDASYFGKIVHKPTLGDPVRGIVPEDIRRADRLMMTASILGYLIALAVRYRILTLLYI